MTMGFNDELDKIVCDVLGDCVTLGIKIHSGGCSVFTERIKYIKFSLSQSLVFFSNSKMN